MLSSTNVVIQSKGSTNSLRSREIQGFWLVEISRNVNFVQFGWKLICRGFMGLRMKANSFRQNSRLLIGRNFNFVQFGWKLVCRGFMGLQMKANCFRQNSWLLIGWNVNFVRFGWKLICRGFMGLQTKAKSFHQNSKLLIGRNVNFVWFGWKLVCSGFMGLRMKGNCSTTPYRSYCLYCLLLYVWKSSFWDDSYYPNIYCYSGDY